MYIRRKVFSLLQDETGEERYFSTREILLEDEEERLFSILDEEDLEQKEFARRDYEGLTEAQQRVLKRHRSEYAKSLNSARNKITASGTKKVLADGGYNSVTSTSKVSGGGVISNIRAKDIAGDLDNYDTLSKRHAGNFRNAALKESENAKRLMRENIERGLHDDEVKSVERASERLKNIKANKAAREAAEKAATKSTVPEKITEETAEKLSKKGFKLGKAGKIALGTAAVLGTAYGAKKLYDKNKKREEK